MDPCTFPDAEARFDALVAAHASALGIDPVCSTTRWIAPLAAAFAPAASPRLFSSDAGMVTLLEHANSVISRDALFDALERKASSPFDRTIDVLVSRVRRKIEDNPRKPKVLVTVRNTGYMLSAEVEKTTDTAAA